MDHDPSLKTICHLIAAALNGGVGAIARPVWMRVSEGVATLDVFYDMESGTWCVGDPPPIGPLKGKHSPLLGYCYVCGDGLPQMHLDLPPPHPTLDLCTDCSTEVFELWDTYVLGRKSMDMFCEAVDQLAEERRRAGD